MTRVTPPYSEFMDRFAWNLGEYDYDSSTGRPIKPSSNDVYSGHPGDIMHPNHPIHKQKADGKLCGYSIATSSMIGALGGARTAGSLGAAVCGASPPLYPGCVLGFVLGGASAGALTGGLAAQQTPACRDAVIPSAPWSPPPCPISSMPPAMPNCPTHGSQHSCSDNPTPAPQPTSRSKSNQPRGCPGRACPPGGGGGGSCGGGCGCGC